jgi:hypothetical protein
MSNKEHCMDTMEIPTNRGTETDVENILPTEEDEEKNDCQVVGCRETHVCDSIREIRTVIGVFVDPIKLYRPEMQLRNTGSWHCNWQTQVHRELYVLRVLNSYVEPTTRS